MHYVQMLCIQSFMAFLDATQARRSSFSAPNQGGHRRPQPIKRLGQSEVGHPIRLLPSLGPLSCAHDYTYSCRHDFNSIFEEII